MNSLQKILTKINNAFSLDLLVMLVVVGLGLYLKSLFNGFIGDDVTQILTNEYVRNGNVFSVFGAGTFGTGGGGMPGVYYKPLMTLFFQLTYDVFGSLSFGYHVLSLLVHVANVILLFFLSRKIFLLEKFRYSQAIAFLFSLLFLVHPANTEVVVWIACLQDILATFFLLAAMLFLFKITEKLHVSWKTYVLLGILLLCALFSKESGIVALCLSIVYGMLFAQKQLKSVLIVNGAVILVYLYFRLQIARIGFFLPLRFIPIHEATLPQRLLTIPYELCNYLRLIFFPKDLFVFDHTVVTSMSDPRFYIALPVLFFVIAVLVWFAFLLRSKIYIFFLFWMVFSFGIIINIIPLDMTIAERWLYMPFIGFLFTVFLIGNYLAGKWKRVSYVLLGILVVGLPVLAARSFVRSLNWKDNFTLYSHDIRLNPNSYELLNDYGASLITAGQYKKAEEVLNQSRQLSPLYWSIYSNLGWAYYKDGQVEPAKRNLMLAVSLGGMYTAYEHLAEVLLQTGKPEEVIGILQRGLSYYPNNANLLVIAAKTYVKLGRTEQARIYAQKAVLISPASYGDPVIQSLVPPVQQP